MILPVVIYLDYFAGTDWEVQGEGHCVLWVGHFYLRGLHADRAPFPHRVVAVRSTAQNKLYNKPF